MQVRFLPGVPLAQRGRSPILRSFYTFPLEGDKGGTTLQKRLFFWYNYQIKTKDENKNKNINKRKPHFK